jgi:signal transduction histidine kinase
MMPVSMIGLYGMAVVFVGWLAPGQEASLIFNASLVVLALGIQGVIAAQYALHARARTAELEVSKRALERAYRDLQGTQAQMLQSEKLASLGQLVAGVAHEINNPVTFIAGSIVPLERTVQRIRKLASETDVPDLSTIADEAETIVDIIAQGAERTAAIVRDLRLFSRGGDEVAKPVDVHEGIDISLRLLGPSLGDRITVHRDYGQIPPVRIVPGQLNQVLMNLLSNACDAIEGTGNIWLSTVRDGRMVRITVRDDGIGIPDDKLARIFDPFFTTKQPGKGTGLGLAISHGIVGRHGGQIRVKSTAGVGTTFELLLPVTDPDDSGEKDSGKVASS